MKQRIFLLCMLLCCTAALTACGAAQDAVSIPASGEGAAATAPEDAAAPSAPAADRAAQMAQYGRLERLRMDVPADSPAAVQADSFSISVQEVDALAQEYMIYSGCDSDTAREKALDLLIEQYAVYHYALAQGYAVTDAQLDELIADEQDSDAENPKDFAQFLQGFDGDESLYRTFQRNALRVQSTVELFRDACQQEYAATGGSDFAAYYRALVDEIIAGEHVQIL